MVPEKDEQKITYGFIVGIPVEISLSDKFGLYTALTYHQKGSKYETTYYAFDAYCEIDGMMKYNYLELPVQGKFYFTKKTLSVYLLAGPGFGYAVNARAKMDIDIYDEIEGYRHESSDEKIKFKDMKDSGMRRLDISIVLGGGLSYQAWIGEFFFSINYNHGLINFVDDEDYEINEGVKELHRGLNITCGYLIPLSR